MADKRMFHRSVVLSDDYMDLSSDARCLYVTMSMMADDDGFVDAPKGAMRTCGASPDNLQELINAKFIYQFASGVVCIRHWCLNNDQRKDRKKDTQYKDELGLLETNSDGVYTLIDNQMTTKCQPSDNQMTSIGGGQNDLCPRRIEENRIEENRIDNNICQQVVDAYHELCPSFAKIRQFTDKRKTQVKTRLKKYSLDDFKEVFAKAEQSDFLKGSNGWKASFDWLISEGNMVKVLEGNFDNKGKNIEERSYSNDLERMLLGRNVSL